MSANTPVSALPYAQLSDTANANTLSQGIATALDHVVIPKYATTTARDAANTAPVEGDMCYISVAGAGKGYYQYSGTAWIGPLKSNQTWTAYTPTWNTSSGLHTPSLGNGVFNCRYFRLGSLCMVNFSQIMGTTTNFNSGGASDNWQWTLPIQAASTWGGYAGSLVVENSAGTDWLCSVQFSASATLFNLQNTAAGVSSSGVATNGLNGGAVDAVTPFTFTATAANLIKGQFFYEV